MFRRERPQKGRFRQFYQIGAEAIGSESPIVDAEVIEMVVEVLQRVGHRRISSADQLGRRSRIAARRIMALLKEKLRDVAPTNVQRLPAPRGRRILCACSIARFREDQPIIETLPSILDHLCEECRAHFAAVRAHLDARGIPYEVRPRMVRGLDYYMRTTFEITHGALGAQNSVLGGGRYDGLAESLGLEESPRPESDSPSAKIAW